MMPGGPDPLNVSPTLTDHQWRLGVLIALTLAVLLSLSRIADLPADGHEVFVLETTQEMHDHGNWVVPWFNDQLRLRKPPLNYWLTGIVAALDQALDPGTDYRVKEWHGRLPSALAMLGLVWLTLMLGRRYYDRGTALLAALMLIASSGYFGYAHDARPDPLYALLCTLGYSAWLVARDQAGHRQLLIAGMWLSFALATLSKGPQLPVMLLLACLIEARLRGAGWWPALRELQPLTGLLSVLAITLPWWWLLRQQVEGAQLAHSQLSGTLLTMDWSRLLNPYYLYRPWQMLLPWAVLLPLALIGGWRSRPPGPFTRSLLLLYLIPALTLSLGPQQRWFYMLPVLTPMALLLARGLILFLEGRAAWARRVTPLLILLAVAGLAYTVEELARSGQQAGWAVLAGAAGMGLVLLDWLYRGRRDTGIWQSCYGITLIGLALLSLSGTRVLWSADRFHNRDVGRQAGTTIARSTALIAWRLNPNVLVYYSQRFIPALWDARDLRRTLASHAGGIAVLTPASRLSELRRDYRVDPITAPPANQKFAVLLRLRPRASIQDARVDIRSP